MDTEGTTAGTMAAVDIDGDGYTGMGIQFYNILNIKRYVKVKVKVYLKGPKHDQIECGFFYINPSSMDR